jgi:hypothetical protein
MNYVKTILVLMMVSVLVPSFSQSDSSDFTFNGSAPKWDAPEDKLYYPTETFKEYHLDFDVSDLAAVDKIWLELGLAGFSQIISHKSYSKSELSSLGFISGNHVSVSFGNLEIANYEINVVIEKKNKKMSQKFTKSVNQ